MKKRVGLLIIGSICLLPLFSSEVQAQQPATIPSTTAQSAAISIEKLKSRQLAIESMVDIDAAAKTDSLRYLDRAIKDLSIAANTNKKAAELSQLIQTAPDRMKLLQAELEKPITTPEIVETRAQAMSTLKLEQRLLQKEAEFATAQSRLQQWSDRLAAEKISSINPPNRLPMPPAGSTTFRLSWK